MGLLTHGQIYFTRARGPYIDIFASIINQILLSIFLVTLKAKEMNGELGKNRKGWEWKMIQQVHTEKKVKSKVVN